ncbi:MAG: hypothetical protein IJH34_16425, partial [Romboutsia sp.]|nr:hypothetical protein [Romboutsia sp.]
MSERINIDIIFNSEKVNIQGLKTWSNIMNYFCPTYMSGEKITRGKLKKFNRKVFLENIELELSEDENDIMIKDDRNYISIYKTKNKKGIISA